MAKIAYKTNTDNPNLPNGFITDHFETDQDQIEGHTVVELAVFSAVLQGNVALLRQHEVNAGPQGAAQGLQVHPMRPAEHAQPVSQEIMAQHKVVMQQNTENARLFQEFMAWKNSQNQGS